MPSERRQRSVTTQCLDSTRMAGVHDFALFLAAGLALNLTPGPDMLFVAARSMRQGRAAGVVSALGIGAGCFVHIFAVAFGLAVVLRAVPAAYDFVRFIGAAYLMYLGLRTLLRREENAARLRSSPVSLEEKFSGKARRITF
jgi:threonine/homoserine/homoserine lactone efflux protein